MSIAEEKIYLFLKRTYQPEQTIGEMEIMQEGKIYYSCKTVELKWFGNKRRMSCIPVGTYDVVKRNSPKYGDHFQILNVPDRDWVLIHSANYSRQLLGCIGVGKAHTDIDKDGLIDITSSKATLSEMNKILPDKFKLVIT